MLLARGEDLTILVNFFSTDATNPLEPRYPSK